VIGRIRIEWKLAFEHREARKELTGNPTELIAV
jgi:hypothetical protein